jgi:hypothetical protein
MMLAAWRLSSLLVQEDGPARVFAHVRARTSLWGVLECLWCASVWVALLVLVLERIAPRLVDVLAISAGAIAVDRWNSS